MKRIKYILFTLSVFCIGIISVNAAPSVSLGTSKATIENGSSVTASITLKNVAAWNVKINSSGNTSGCSQAFADATTNGGNTTKTLSVTCKATSIGVIGFTFSGDATSADGTTSKISGSKRVTVTAKRPLSENAYLKSLSVEGYELSPAFDDEVVEYSTTVPSTVNSIKINGEKAESHATVSGTGEFEVNEGSNVFTVTVTAETGATKDYKVNVIVEDLNPIIIKINDTNYTIIKNPKNIEVPTLFTESTVTINELQIPSYYNETTDITLVPIKDESGKQYFAVYKDDSYQLYKQVIIGNMILYLQDYEELLNDYTDSTITIGDFEVKAMNINDDFYVINAINMATGEELLYKYDSKEGTAQRYDATIEEQLNKKNKDLILIIIIFASGLALSLLLSILTVISKRKQSKKINEYIEKMKTKKEKVSDETKEFKKNELKDTKKVNLDNTIKVEKVNKNKKKK